MCAVCAARVCFPALRATREAEPRSKDLPLLLPAAPSSPLPPPPPPSLPLCLPPSPGGLCKGPWAGVITAASKPMPLGRPQTPGPWRAAGSWPAPGFSSHRPPGSGKSWADGTNASGNNWFERIDCLLLPPGVGLRHSCAGLSFQPRPGFGSPGACWMQLSPSVGLMSDTRQRSPVIQASWLEARGVQ